MTRKVITQEEFREIKRSFLHTAEEVRLGNESGIEHDAVYTEHLHVVSNIVAEIEARGWSPLHDVYVLYDCFRARIIYVTLLPELRDAAEDAILKTLLRKENRRYAVIVDMDPVPDLCCEEIDVLTSGGIFVLRNKLD